jgi:hypothetical protein
MTTGRAGQSGRSVGMVVVALAMLGATLLGADAQKTTAGETALRVRQALLRLPYYGVFDFLAFGVDRGTVTLRG